MDIPHVDIVKKKLGDEAVSAMQALFKDARGHPPGVPVERFRANHPEWMDVLDDLQYRYSLIVRSPDGKKYLLQSYALPLIAEAKSILEKMQRVYSRMRDLYPEHLSDTISPSCVLEGLEGDETVWLDALYYLTECGGVVSGRSIDFPYGEENNLTIAEGVLRKLSVADLLSQFYEWHYVNPSRVASQWIVDDDLEGAESSIFAQELKGGFPLWYEELDDTIKSLIREIDIALTQKQSVLPMIGFRTLLDIVMVEKLGDIGGFGEKLQAFEKKGYVTARDSDLISSVLDAGNAAAHRAYSPNEDALKACVDVVKHVMEGLYVLQPKVKRLRETTPGREKMKK